MKRAVDKSKFIVADIKKETADVVTLYLAPAGKRLDYKAGQYVAVYLDKDKDSHGKFYTLSSSPTEKIPTISVKKVGQFSSALHNLKIGDSVYLSGPYGCFYPETGVGHAIFLAAGIGVTPFLSILKYYKDKGISQKIDLYYTNKTLLDTAFCEELKTLNQGNYWKLFSFLTRDRSGNRSDDNYKRIKAGDIKKGSGRLDGKDFYICGPISFVSDLRKQLLVAGVREERIFTEAFF